jgi:hypothetical protein
MIEDHQDATVRYIDYDLDEADTSMQHAFDHFEELDGAHRVIARKSFNDRLQEWGEQLDD